jgi:transposase
MWAFVTAAYRGVRVLAPGVRRSTLHRSQFEISELIDVVKVEYKLVQVKQQKNVCRCGGCVETALGPARAAAGSRYSLDVAIKVVVDKYLDHLPLASQVRVMERLGLDIRSQHVAPTATSTRLDPTRSGEQQRPSPTALPVFDSPCSICLQRRLQATSGVPRMVAPGAEPPL